MPSFSFGTTPSFSAAAPLAAQEEGEGEGAAEVEELGDEPPVAIAGNIGSLLPGEKVAHEEKGRLRRYDKESKEWKDLDVGNLTLISGSPSRLVFAQLNAPRPNFRATVDANTRLEVLPDRGEKPGGLSLMLLAVIGAKQELCKILFTVKTVKQQTALAEEITRLKK